VKFTIERNAVYEPLQLLMGVIDRRQTVPVLSNLLLSAVEGRLTLVGSNLEQELVVSLPVESEEDGEMTLPGRKLFEICRNMSPGALVGFEGSNHAAVVSSNRFRSQLKGLPAHDFPQIELSEIRLQVTIESALLRQLLGRVEFAMAHQDVRYFFNGLLLDFDGDRLSAVATNGQRLAHAEMLVDAHDVGHIQAIVPRKSISELLKLVKLDGDIELTVTREHLCIELGEARFTTKLVDATYPDYSKAIPRNGDKFALIPRAELKDALVRMSIVSNELYHNVKLSFSSGQLHLSTHNSMREEAEEVLDMFYTGEPVEIGFNVSYLIEILSTMRGEQVQMVLSDSGSAVLFEDPDDGSAEYVVSPMVI
jgi:DNA polymerase-3 subunit beta